MSNLEQLKIKPLKTKIIVNYHPNLNLRVKEIQNGDEPIIVYQDPTYRKRNFRNDTTVAIVCTIGKRTEIGRYMLIFEDLDQNKIITNKKYSIKRKFPINWHDEFMKVFYESEFKIDPIQSPYKMHKKQLQQEIRRISTGESKNIKLDAINSLRAKKGFFFKKDHEFTNNAKGKNFCPDSFIEIDEKVLIVEFEETDPFKKIDNFINYLSFDLGYSECINQFSKINIKESFPLEFGQKIENYEFWNFFKEKSRIQYLETDNENSDIKNVIINYKKGFYSCIALFVEIIEHILEWEGKIPEKLKELPEETYTACLLIVREPEHLEESEKYLRTKIERIISEWSDLDTYLKYNLANSLEINMKIVNFERPGLLRRLYDPKILLRNLIDEIDIESVFYAILGNIF